TLDVEEHQRPNLFAGYHHEWSPGMHTLLLGARLDDTFDLKDQNVIIPGVIRDESGQVTDTVEKLCERFGIDPAINCDLFDSLKFRSEFEAYSVELQQIAQVSRHMLIFGGRFQTGETETHAEEIRGPRFPPYAQGFSDFVSTQTNTTDLIRLSLYAYDQWQ